MSAKQRAKRGQTHPVCLHAMEKYKKADCFNAQNDYKTASEKWTDKQTYFLCFLSKCLNSKKINSRSFKRISRKK